MLYIYDRSFVWTIYYMNASGQYDQPQNDAMQVGPTWLVP